MKTLQSVKNFMFVKKPVRQIVVPQVFFASIKHPLT